MRIAKWGLLILLISPLSIASARAQDQTPPSSDQQGDSLAAAARRTQEQKKEQPKAAKVWDNDSIPSTPGGVSVVGQAPPPAENAAAPQNPPPAHPATAEDKAAIQNDLTAAKAELDSLKTDLDIAQRKLTLDQQMYDVKPDKASDKAGAAALKDEQDDIDAKKQAVADAEKKLADLQAKLDAANSDNSK